jgi:hypothetical protein
VRAGHKRAVVVVLAREKKRSAAETTRPSVAIEEDAPENVPHHIVDSTTY